MWIYTYTHINTKEVERSYIIKRSYVIFKQYYFPAAVFSNTLSSPEEFKSNPQILFQCFMCNSSMLVIRSLYTTVYSMEITEDICIMLELFVFGEYMGNRCLVVTLVWQACVCIHADGLFMIAK